MLRRWGYLAGALSLVVMAAACGGDDDATPDGPAATPAPTVEAEPEATPETTDDAEPAPEPTDAGTDPEEPESDVSQDDIDALGSEAIVAELDRLYQAAIDSGETSVVVYGPGEDDKLPVYELFMERYPEIDVRGEYLVGPDMDSKINAEVASGRRIASLLQSGDTSLAPKLPSDDEEGLIAEFTPITVEGLDADFTDAEGRYAFAASASTFGILYNTNNVSADEAPTGWLDLHDPVWEGRLAWDDPTRFGSAFGFFNKVLADPRYDESFVAGFAANGVHVEASAPAAGNRIATGEFDVNLAYPYSFFLRDLARGAPVDLVFPVEGGNHLSPHFVGLMEGAPSPDAAKLLMSWLFTPEAQAATSQVGYYPTMPGVPGPDGNPPVDELDLLAAIPLATVNAISGANLAVVQDAWNS